MKSFKRGFTLIELLVVIAIIGILASVVLAALNNARSKGGDAAVRSGLSSVRSQAELYYHDNNGSYLNICANAKVASMLGSIRDSAGLSATTSINTAGQSTAVTCNHATDDYAIQSPLKTSGYFCVDRDGRATSSTGNLLANGTDYDCI